MTSYRRYVAQHGAAIHRAKQQVRRHAWETGPTFPDAIEKDLGNQTFREFVRGLSSLTVKLQQVKIPAPRFSVASIADPESWQHRERGCSGMWELHTDGRHRRCAECRELMRPLGHGEVRPAWTEPDPVVAYRSKFSRSLYCMTCAGNGRFGIPLTSDDLPDGGLCASCGRDVLIPAPAIAPAECPACSHKHIEGVECVLELGPDSYCGCTG